MREQFCNQPGTALSSLIPDWATDIQSGCTCKDYAKKMDKWGTDGCKKRRPEIIQHLLKQDEKLIPAFRALPDWSKRIAANGLLTTAIKLSEC